VQAIQDKLRDLQNDSKPRGNSPTNDAIEHSFLRLQPIGFIQTWFKSKNGTPRQPSICQNAKGLLKIDRLKGGARGEHALEGLDRFSHIWILFVFHKNGQGQYSKAKVKPPRAGGEQLTLPMSALIPSSRPKFGLVFN